MSDEQLGVTTAEILEAARGAGEAIVRATAGWAFSAAAMASAADTERLYVEGFHYGLNDPEIAETIKVWCQEAGFSTSDPRVRQALIDRSMGGEWRPPAAAD